MASYTTGYLIDTIIAGAAALLMLVPARPARLLGVTSLVGRESRNRKPLTGCDTFTRLRSGTSRTALGKEHTAAVCCLHSV